MLPVISALLAFVAGLFRSHCAWNHWPCGINWRSINRPLIAPASGRPIVCSRRGCLVCSQAGNMAWRSFSLVPLLFGSASAFATTSDN